MTVFFISTKLPTREPALITVPGRRRENGPAWTSSSRTQPSMTVASKILTRFPIRESAMRTFGEIRQSLPMRASPSMTTEGEMTVSPPTRTPRSIQVADGSTTVTPAAESSRIFRSRRTEAATARS